VWVLGTGVSWSRFILSADWLKTRNADLKKKLNEDGQDEQEEQSIKGLFFYGMSG
jgi:hypothetical protein